MTENKKLSSINKICIFKIYGDGYKSAILYSFGYNYYKSDVPILYYINVSMWENASFATT